MQEVFSVFMLFNLCFCSQLMGPCFPNDLHVCLFTFKRHTHNKIMRCDHSLIWWSFCWMLCIMYIVVTSVLLFSCQMMQLQIWDYLCILKAEISVRAGHWADITVNVISMFLHCFMLFYAVIELTVNFWVKKLWLVVQCSYMAVS